ncbi:uncharacterized protein gask1a isoform X2 [Echeneis naucrates]|uniref:Golgi associated kinase 1A n=1 Tax=Echeneis naucrates TaxID=173247 RepID=A0A665WPE5_ECHNA|nr:Golgi-associated kinase 1A isoform X2 [Echeneis naucrates]
MAWRVWSKLCCGQKWLLLLFSVILLLLTISVTTITLPFPTPPADLDRRSSWALSSAGRFIIKPTVMQPTPVAHSQQPFPHIHNAAWTGRHGKQHEDKNSIKKSHIDLPRNKDESKEISGNIQQPTSHHHPRLLQFTVSKGPKHRTKPSSHGALMRHSAQTDIYLKRRKSMTAHIPVAADTLMKNRQAESTNDRQTDRSTDMQMHGSNSSGKLVEYHQALGKHRKTAKHLRKSDKEQQAVKKPSRDLKKHNKPSQGPSEVNDDPVLLNRRKTWSRPEASVTKDISSWCGRFTHHDFPDDDHRRLRISPDLCSLPWFSKDDIKRMELLTSGEVVSKARVPAHGQVLQVSLESPTSQRRVSHHHKQEQTHPESHTERCQQGRCSLIKRTNDWFEVFAFHLDRVLGLNRSLPAVLRTFHSDILPYQYISGLPRPIVWWDPDIQHLADGDNDQNSVPLSWVQYQKLLQVHCGSKADLSSAPCVGVHHSEWGRLALFDFLLQVHDRLDRYCCGFTPDPTEVCVENLLHNKCYNTKDLLLVHILVKKADPSRLVFIDNAGRPHQSSNNLNFRLVEGIDEFPERAISVLKSGCLESLLLHSLYTDKEFWDSHGGLSGLRPLIHMVQQRGKILLQHIRDRKLQLNRDL